MESSLFNSMPQPQSRWKAFAAGWSAQAVGITGLLVASAMLPSTVQQVRHYSTTPLVAYEAPEPKPYQPAPRIAPRLRVPVPTTPPAIVMPRAERAIPQPEVAAPEVRMAAKLPDIPIAPQQPKVVATDTFSAGKMDKPTTAKPAAAVQMGGFGDPNGVAAHDTHGPANIAASGFSDLPNGSGRGNGYGGPNAGVVASSGFGAGVAGTHAGGSGTVQQSGFSGFSSAPAAKRIVASAAPTIPVEILSKPVPDYTSEGRELKIDGEVRLEVLFTINGQAHVIRVIQGLGHGLDEQAVRAAQQIKFKPALHEGQPVDSTAVVHIIFQLVS